MSSFLFYLAESSVCLALFYLIYRALLSRETFFSTNRFFLMFSIPLSFVIPLIDIPSPFRTITAAPPPGYHPALSPLRTNAFGFMDILTIIYLLGAGFFLFRFFYNIVQLFHLIRKSGHQKCGRLKLVFIDQNTAPFSFFNFFFLNKSNISQHDLLRIIDHELVHINQHHTIDLLIIELLSIVEWFNPFVRPYKKSIKETHEYLADDKVIAQGCSRAKYQMLIFEQHVGLKLFTFVNSFNQSLIKRRMTMMTKGKSKTWAKTKFLLLIPMIGFLVLAFAHPKAVSPTVNAKLNAELGTSAPEDGNKKIQSTDQEKKEKEKRLNEIMHEEQMLIEKLEATDNPEERKQIKQKLIEIQKMLKQEGWETTNEEQMLIEKLEATEDPEVRKELKMKLEEIQKMKTKPVTMSEQQYNDTITELKTLIEKSENPEETAKLKEKLADLMEMKEKGWVKSETAIEYEAKAAELKKLWEKTDDPQKKKEIEEKLKQLKQMMQKEKEKK
jgi:hypothetical protein